MQESVRTLNGDFGVLIEDVAPARLTDPAFQAEASALWAEHGVLAVRGEALADLSPDEMMDWGDVFGTVDRTVASARDALSVPGTPILRIGNARDETGAFIAQYVDAPLVEDDADIRYDPITQRPVWHTDSVFNPNPPIGSLLHCKAAPERGGQTLFADTRRAYAALNAATQDALSRLEAVCSLAHHDRKINRYTPTYPVLSEAQRAANPPNRVPVVLTHPVSGEPAIYGLNSSTCALLPKGTPVAPAQQDYWDLEGIEDESVSILRDLLPFLTGPAFTIKWDWRPGDLVVWDNRCTMHAGTGFDPVRHFRDMWRVILLAPEDATGGRAPT
ncbi:MAG: TauD/TfdA family dioxygenase [Marivibrio sp.]|uniref:TauD/TfdA dioxygenase family protein n=1 Tax=Marivibrio sp. TaxID=2039719 RepID=UPI0032ED22A3